MRHVVLTPDAEIHVKAGDWRSAFGSRPAARVQLLEGTGLIGWIADDAVTRPDRYSSNVSGSGVLVSCGARLHVYAGPVVVTGDRDGDPAGLAGKRVGWLVTLHRDVMAALAGASFGDEDMDVWAVQMRAIAAVAASFERGGP